MAAWGRGELFGGAPFPFGDDMRSRRHRPREGIQVTEPAGAVVHVVEDDELSCTPPPACCGRRAMRHGSTRRRMSSQHLPAGPGCIVLDPQMPGSSGFDPAGTARVGRRRVADRLRERPRDRAEDGARDEERVVDFPTKLVTWTRPRRGRPRAGAGRGGGACAASNARPAGATSGSRHGSARSSRT